MGFSKWVSPEVAYKATFNYYEPSFSIERCGRRFTIYHTKYPAPPEPNLVVIEAEDNLNEFYFRTFLGKHGGECETDEETKLFFKEIERTISSEFRIEGIYLEERILQVVNSVNQRKFSNMS